MGGGGRDKQELVGSGEGESGLVDLLFGEGKCARVWEQEELGRGE